MARPLLLRCKTNEGQHIIENLTSENTVEDLKAILFSITAINPKKLRVLTGFPPRELDLTHERDKLEHVLHQQRETLIVEEVNDDVCDNRKQNTTSQASRSSPYIVPNKAANKQSLKSAQQQHKHNSNHVSSDIPAGVLMRRVVPANNSCLFTSIYFSLSNGEYNDKIGPALRQVIADTVADDVETYNEAFLGKPNREYCTWILNEDHWGGAIELSILSQHYSIEMVAVDTLNVRCHRFGEDKNYATRILLIYDGIHYDPLMLETFNGEGQVQTIFSTSNDEIIEMALNLAREAKASRQYTDVQNFSLRCLNCNTKLRGNEQATSHAKETGHINFGEV